MLLLVAFGCDDAPQGPARPDASGVARDTGPFDSAPGDAFPDDTGLGDAEPDHDAFGAGDLGLQADASVVRDGGPSLADATLLIDASSPADSGTDAATPADTGQAADSGAWLDAELAPDAEEAMDATTAPDLGTPDLGTPGTGEVWIELDYTNAYTPRSPTWRFSNTPGWGPAQWAMEGDTWPEAWDRWNNMTVGSDPIGTSLLIGSSSELQLMIGLEEMLSYQSMTVRLEGRSRSTCCSLTFYVTNPLNNCGTSAQMSNDWNPDIIDVPLNTCLLTGPSGRIEAVRIDPQSGTMALRRMRVTLHGASW